jgi:hypothetical protein
MEQKLSEHEVRIVHAFKDNPGKWFTSGDIATAAHVAGRTARQYTRELTELGVIEEAKTFPAARFKWSEKGARKNAAYLRKIDEAASVFDDAYAGIGG